ncbi:NUM1 (YDR150W) [Zygosaccharomyces parabailii]|uniref:ZYBA0S08-01706g1_1 n=1 Tax=Zygosaccharomyces bailii (strain CLIB 213 / ATCC 58445 / CBS 680 / BCRC 21525 / NBRC 1098 / NCYC 1416 / NRRL Y-2227) TaxID=1333698 RepID=A0A8J2TA78_ZYGB2|nr:NUM1 (YDR150W) [Zygosaccharomyces parabailii]CDF90733.1 ZYBA0S08-01706g1_1 [Zygosaccharomyces bailii CLIB 213]CDH08917.1 uncharacterized protein ZBAI_00700 [Zygosaccharomyces bailii ISA1307]
MSSNSNKRESLLTQLENMHKQLNDESEAKAGQSNATDVTQGAGIKKPNLFSNVLNRREKANPMPMFAGSAAHNGVLTANNGKDMSFVMGLSENLLVECRRLQAENEKKTKKLKQVQEEFEQVDEKHKKLDSFHQLTTKELNALRDTNWELEVKVQQFTVELRELKDKLGKNRKELKTEQENSQNTKAELEVAVLQRSGLEKELSQREKEHSSELTDLKKQISELNDENDSLYTKLQTLDEISIDRKALQVELSQSNKLTDQLKQQIVHLETRNKDYAENFTASQKQISQSNVVIDQLKQQVLNLEAEGKMTINAKVIESELSQSRNEVIKLREQLVSLEAKQTSYPQDLQLELSNSKQLVEDLRQQLKKLKGNKSGKGKSKVQKNKNDSTHSENIKEASGDEKEVINSRDSAIMAEGSERGDVHYDISEFSLTELEKYAKLYNMILVPETEYTTTNSKDSKKTDSQEQLVNTVGDTNLLALPNDNSSKKKSVDDSTSIESMIKKLESSGYRVLSFPEFNEKQEQLKELEDPSETFLMSKASHLHKILISQDSYDKLANPTLSQLSSKLEELGFTIMKIDEHEKLLESIEKPNSKYLEEKLALNNKVAISKEEYKQYTSPNEKFIKDHAKAIGYVAVIKESYETMKKQVTQPSIETILKNLEKDDYRGIISQFCAKHHLVLLEKSKHDQLISSINNPSRKYLEEKCPSQQIQPVPVDKYNKLLQDLKNPTLDFMNEKAASMNKKLIPIKTYQKLQSTSEKPTLEFIKENAKKSGFILLSESDYISMKKMLDEPDLEYLQSRAKHHKLVDLDTYRLLKQNFDNPPLEFLTQKASAKDYDLVGTNTHKELLRKAMHPSEAEVKHFAEGLGAVLVQVHEYESLKAAENSPSKDFIVEKAKKLNLVVMSEKEYQKSQKIASDKNYLLSSIKQFGFIPVPAPELITLRGSTLENSSLDNIEKKLQSLGYVAVPYERFKELNRPLTERATKEETLLLCSKYSFKPVSLGEYQKLKDDSKPTVYSEDELVGALKSRGYVVLAEDEYNDMKGLIASPTAEFLQKHAATQGSIIIARKEHEKQVNMIAQPSLAYLKEKTSVLGYRIESEKELDKLHKQLDSPSSDYLQQKAPLLNMKIVSQEKYQKMMNEINNPSLSYLQSKAAAMKKQVIDGAEYRELQRKTTFPTLEEIEAYAVTLNMVLVVKDEQENLLKQVNHPTLDYLKQSLEQYDAIPVALPEYNSLRKNVEEPTTDYLSDKAASRDMLIVSKAEYNKQMERLIDPSEKDVIEDAKKFSKILASPSDLKTTEEAHLVEDIEKGNSVVISRNELIELKQAVKNPSEDTMKSGLEKLNYVVRQSREFEELIRRVETPSLDEIANSAKSQGYVLVRAQDLAKHTTVDTEDLDSLTQSGSYVLLNADEYDGLLKSSAGKMSKREIMAICKKFELIPVLSSEYEQFTVPPDVNKIKQYALDNDMTVISCKDFDLLKAKAEIPLEQSVKKFTEEQNLMLLEKSSYDRLLNKISNPSKEELKKQAGKIGLAVIPADQYNIFVERTNKQQLFVQNSYDEKENRRSLASHKSNENSETSRVITGGYDTTSSGVVPLNLAQSNIYGAAEKLGLTILSTEEYKNLLSKKFVTDGTSYNELEELAKKFAMKLVPLKSPADDKSSTSASQLRLTIADESRNALIKTRSSNSTIVSMNTTYYDADEENQADKFIACNKEIQEKTYTQVDDHSQASLPEKTIPSDTSLETSVIKRSETLKDDDLKQNAAAEGFVLVSAQEYDEILKLKGKMKSSSILHAEDDVSWYDASDFGDDINEETALLAKRAGRLGQSLLPTPVYQEYLHYKNATTKEMLEEQATQLGLIVLEEEAFNELTLKADESKDRMKDLANKYGYHMMSGEEYTNLKEQSQNAEIDSANIQSKAQELGYHVLTEKEYEDLKETLCEGTRKLTKEELQEKAAEYGLVTLPMKAYEELTSSGHARKPLKITRDELEERASEMGFTAVPNDRYKELVCSRATQELPRGELEKRASQLNLVILSTSEYKRLTSKPNVTKEVITSRAKEYGLTMVPTKTYDALTVQNLSMNSKEGLSSHAQKLGLRVLDEEQYGDLLNNTKHQGVSKKDAERKNSVKEIQPAKKNTGSSLSKDDIVNACGKFGMVAISKKEHVRLHNLAKTESLKQRAQEANMICLPRSTMVASPASYSSKQEDDVVVLPTAYYKKLLSKEISTISKRKQQERDMKPAQKPLQKPEHEMRFVQATQKPKEKRSAASLRSTASRSGKRDLAGPRSATAFPAAAHNEPSAIPRDKSMGALSLNTIESLDDPSIIPALTQVVIGEYLHKYYQVLGLGQESRHERYFWVHPYTLTLYWSPTNPVLESPANHRARCASIVGVDSVNDKNASQGIYHKILVITTDTRVIKIACPSRQRHNVWYNSLRYLMQRSMDGINLEDIAENPGDTMYSGKIYPLSKHTSQKLPRSKSMSLLKGKH